MEKFGEGSWVTVQTADSEWNGVTGRVRQVNGSYRMVVFQWYKYSGDITETWRDIKDRDLQEADPVKPYKSCPMGNTPSHTTPERSGERTDPWPSIQRQVQDENDLADSYGTPRRRW